MQAQLIDQVPVGNVLGEGVLWDDVGHCVWWTDIEECRLYRYTLNDRKVRQVELPERLGSFGLVQDSDRLIAAFESGFAYLDPESGTVEWIVRPVHAARNVRFNDGRVDRQGRFWAGSMVEGVGEPVGKLYSLTKGEVNIHRTGISISNSLCFSPDGRYVYFADSPHRTILRFESDAPSGGLFNPQVFARTAPNASPDGSTIDAEGYLWNAQWGSSRIARYSPDGLISGEILVPVTQPTCIAFGGETLDLMFVTTARQGLGADVLRHQPHAGDLFIYQTDIKGCSESRYRVG